MKERECNKTLQPESSTGEDAESLRDYELIRIWSDDVYTLRLYDTQRTDRDGKSILAYELFDDEYGEHAVFQGADFHCSPLDPIDSDKALACLLHFLSLRPGDTDGEHFETYSENQLEWCQLRGEELSFLAHELEQQYRPLHGGITGHETWDDARQAGRYNRALTLTYSIAGARHRVTLHAGESDNIDTLTDGHDIYVMTTNSGLQYVGLEVFSEGDLIADAFIDDSEVEDLLGNDIWDLSASELLERLLPHLPDDRPPPPFQCDRMKIAERLQELSTDVRKRLQTFLNLGRQNPWVREAWDPPFNELSFQICGNVNELAEKILQGNWSLGQAFVLGNICLINQIDGGDEWLTIKGKTAFESITMQVSSETTEQATERLRETIERIQHATEKQCKKLKY